MRSAIGVLAFAVFASLLPGCSDGKGGSSGTVDGKGDGGAGHDVYASSVEPDAPGAPVDFPDAAVKPPVDSSGNAERDGADASGDSVGDVADSSRGAGRDVADSSRDALGHAIDWRTLYVTLSADDFRLETAGQTFLAQSADIKLHSDPGTPNEYTTLEATWTENGARISLYIYFASNGKEWWASEFALFDVLPEGREVRSDQQAFRRPLGQAFTGDFDLSFPEQNARLLLRGLRVQAFIPPPICQSPIATYAFEIQSSTIDVPVGLTFGVSATLRDANCKVVTSDFRLVWSVDDPTILSLSPASIGRVYLNALVQGKTALRVKALRQKDEVEVASVTMEVIVGPPTPPWEPSP